MLNTTPDQNQLDTEGWTIIHDLVANDQCATIAGSVAQTFSATESSALKSRESVFGARNLISEWNGWKPLLKLAPLRSALKQLLGSKCGLVRLLWFDKPPGAGWALPWHRDQTIAVREHVVDPTPFSRPTVKSGVPHLVAPDSLLQKMLTLRLHLDPMTRENGPLQVISGSHLDTGLPAVEGEGRIETIFAETGSALLMRPLILHGSLPPAPDTKMHRRILHFEFAPDRYLTGDLDWHDFVPVFEQSIVSENNSNGLTG